MYDALEVGTYATWPAEPHGGDVVRSGAQLARGIGAATGGASRAARRRPLAAALRWCARVYLLCLCDAYARNGEEQNLLGQGGKRWLVKWMDYPLVKWNLCR